jgi:hypothetical protein
VRTDALRRASRDRYRVSELQLPYTARQIKSTSEVERAIGQIESEYKVSKAAATLHTT